MRNEMGRIDGSVGPTSARICSIGTIKHLGRVLYAPHLNVNIISVSQLVWRWV
jgi:hypothetical protein